MSATPINPDFQKHVEAMLQRQNELKRVADQIARQANRAIQEQARDDAESSYLIACLVRSFGESILGIAERPYSLKAVEFFETKSS